MIMLALLGSLALSAIYSLAAGWAFMLAVGPIHHEWIPACPTIGYGWAFLIALLLRWALAQLPAGNS